MRNANLMAALALAMVAGTGQAAQAMPTLRTAGDGNNRHPTPPRRDTALAREIAEHNAAVERRKAEKRARKMGR